MQQVHQPKQWAWQGGGAVEEEGEEEQEEPWYRGALGQAASGNGRFDAKIEAWSTSFRLISCWGSQMRYSESSIGENSSIEVQWREELLTIYIISCYKLDIKPYRNRYFLV